MRDDGPVTAGDQRWVLAVDARTAGRLAVAADASGAGPAATPLEQALRDAARRRVAPLAVVVVHPATADGDAAARAADDVGAAVGRAVGADAAEWPWPVPLDALEAAAWRALEFGLLPSRGRVVVVDRSTGEAGIVDREHERLTATGRARATAGAQPEPLLALARALLDEAPAGPPFAGVVVTGAPPAGNDGGAVFAAAVARVTGRPPLVPGDPGTAALLGAASLAWSVVSSTRPAPPPGRPASRADHDEGDDHAGAGVGAGVGAGLGAGQTALPGGPPRRRLPRWARWVLPLAVLAVLAGAAGLLVNRDRSQPSPFVHTCPNGEVVAFSYECPTLAPSRTP